MPRTHGRIATYKAGCRCGVCCEVNRVKQRKMRESHAPVTHGLSGYQNFGCRCDVCKEAGRVNNRAIYVARAAGEL